MLITVIAPTRPSSECGALFNLDWITLVSRWRSCFGAVYYFLAGPDRRFGAHGSTTMEPTGGEQDTS